MAQRTTPKRATYTFETFCERVREDQKADLLDGEIYMASPENTDANEIFMWLAAILQLFIRKKKLGKLYGSRVAFRLDSTNSPEPDIGFIRQERLHLVERGFVNGRPDLAVEIVSPDSIDRDYEQKRTKYEEAGVPEYWIVDEIQQTVLLLRLGRDGTYREVRPRKGTLTSQALPGFWFRPEWFWEHPLQDEDEVCQRILKGSPEK